MKIITSLIATAVLLAGTCLAAPPSDKYNDKNKSLLENGTIWYSSKHDIVKIIPPVREIEIEESESLPATNPPFFFVEADVDEKGDRVYKGLYSFLFTTAKKILDHGTDATSYVDASKQVFLGATEGIYVYNLKDNSLKRYGSVNDSIISIDKIDKDDIYILSDNHVVYKVSENGNKKEKLEDIVNAQQIVLDFSNNLYFFTEDKVPYVRSDKGVKKIEGLPANPSYVEFFKCPYDLKDCVLFLCDKVVYILYANGTSERSNFEIEPDARPYAYAPTGFCQYFYAYDKNIYLFNNKPLKIFDLHKNDYDEVTKYFLRLIRGNGGINKKP